MSSLARQLPSPIILLPIAAALLTGTPARGADLGGSVNVYAISTEFDSTQVTSVNQDYSLHLRKYLSSRLISRFSLGYNRFGTDAEAGGSFWHSNLRPSGELLWGGEIMTISAAARRSESRSRNESTDLVRNNASFDLRTKFDRIPNVTARYDRDHTYNRLDRSARDTRDERIQTSARYTRGSHDVYYGFTGQTSENRHSNLITDQLQHQFRWNGMQRLADNRFQIGGSYNYTRRTERHSTPGAGPSLVPVLALRTLFARDLTPEIGELDTLAALGDGDVATPTAPTIDIGGANTYWNLGFDFGTNRNVSVVHVFTDSVSGIQPGWEAYVSEDNVTWDRVPGTTTAPFDPNFLRYEIRFPEVATRYLKVVNRGFNEIDSVRVTEIEALYERDDTSGAEATQDLHLVDLSSRMRWARALETGLEASWRVGSGGTFQVNRDVLSYAATTTLRPVDMWQNVLRWQEEREEYDDGRDARTRSVSYTAAVKPVSTIALSASATNRVEFLSKMRMRETSNFLAQARTQPLPALAVTWSSSFSRHLQYVDRYTLETWSHRLASEAQVLPSLDVTVSALAQNTTSDRESGIRRKKQLGVRATHRTTRTIHLGGNWDLVNDEGGVRVEQEYRLSWNLSPKLVFGGLYSVVDDPDQPGLERLTASLNYDVGSRTTVFSTYSANRFEEEGRSDWSAVQVGMRTSF